MTSEIEPIILSLKAGGVIAFPTETFYGLGCDPFNFQAVSQLLDLKGRDNLAGVPLIIDTAKRVEEWIEAESAAVSNPRRALCTTFWPGPLTIVFTPKKQIKERLAPGILGPGESLAVRLSSEQTATKLAAAISGAITSTSANPKGQAPPENASAASNYFPDLPVVPRENAAASPASQLPSTIIDVRQLPFKILRQGDIPLSQLQEWL